MSHHFCYREKRKLAKRPISTCQPSPTLIKITISAILSVFRTWIHPNIRRLTSRVVLYFWCRRSLKDRGVWNLVKCHQIRTGLNFDRWLWFNYRRSRLIKTWLSRADKKNPIVRFFPVGKFLYSTKIISHQNRMFLLTAHSVKIIPFCIQPESALTCLTRWVFHSFIRDVKDLSVHFISRSTSRPRTYHQICFIMRMRRRARLPGTSSATLTSI